MKFLSLNMALALILIASVADAAEQTQGSQQQVQPQVQPGQADHAEDIIRTKNDPLPGPSTSRGGTRMTTVQPYGRVVPTKPVEIPPATPAPAAPVVTNYQGPFGEETKVGAPPPPAPPAAAPAKPARKAWYYWFLRN